MSDGHVTENFTRKEFACKCGCGKNFYVSPLLARVLQYLRERVGEALLVTSGMRCAKHNRAVGGSSESYHKLRAGILLASDITFADPAKRTPTGMLKLYVLADNLLRYGVEPGGGLGLYPTWLHIDARGETSARWIDKSWEWPE